MKKAWEEAEPGRAEKAKDARKRFLDRRLIQSVPEASQTGGEPELLSCAMLLVTEIYFGRKICGRC
eukprot:m.131230 g.131230  ORF g.131230 m.131230 type:complete len:66 (+) comp38042_c0_seq5:3967-4164(+)